MKTISCYRTTRIAHIKKFQILIFTLRPLFSFDAVRRKRKDDRYFEPLAKVIHEFEIVKGMKVDRLDLTTWRDKRLRGELLVNIRERCGLKYAEIAELPLFSDIQLGTLGSLYWHSKRRTNKKN